MPVYGYDYQLIKANNVRVLKCRVCGKEMAVKRNVYSGNSVMATLLGKSGIFDEFCCEYSGESWHESALSAVKEAELTLNRDILRNIKRSLMNN